MKSTVLNDLIIAFKVFFLLFFHSFLSLSDIFIFAFIFVIPSSFSKSQLTVATSKTLRVDVAGGEPFVFENTDKGISVEIWDKIAQEKAWKYNYVHFNQVEDALRVLNAGKLDLVIGPISITAKRLETMRFSQPFYNSSISILSRIDNQGLWGKVKPLFSPKLFIAIVIFLIILAVVGALLWLAERNKSPEQFSHKPIQGIGTGMWLAIVTMTTTGYGDKAPVTLMGRIIAGSWMIISIIFATSMVAGIASILTLSTIGTSNITTAEELSQRKAATVLNSPSEEFLVKSKEKVIGASDLREAIEKLENKEVDAVVFDRPQLLYFLKDNKNEDLTISKAEYYKQGYGIAFPINSVLTPEVNRALLELAESQKIEDIVHAYIQKDE